MNVANLTATVSLSAQSFLNSARKIAEKLDDMKERLTDVGSIGKKAIASLSVASVGIAAGGLGALTIGLGSSIKSASEFETIMSRVKAVSGATDEEFVSLNNIAKELGATTRFTAYEAGEGLNFLSMAGLTADESVGALPGVLSLAAASGMDLARTADITSNVLTGFGIAASDSSRVSDVLAKASSTANVDVSMLGETMKYIAPVASSMGHSLEEAAAATGILGNAGVQGSQAGTALRSVLSNIASPVGQAKKAIEALGLEFFDSSGKMKNISGIIEEINLKTQHMTESDRAAVAQKIAGKTAMGGLLVLMNEGSESIANYTAELENSNGVAAEMQAVMNDNLSGSMSMFSSSLDGLKIRIGEAFLEPLKKTVDVGTLFVGKISEIIAKIMEVDNVNQTIDNLSNRFVDFTTRIIDTYLNVDNMVALIGVLAAVLGTAGLIATLTLVSFAISALLSPIGLASAAIVAFGVVWHTDFLKIKTITQTFFNWMFSLDWRSIFTTIQGYIDAFNAYVLRAWEYIKQITNNLYTQIYDIISNRVNLIIEAWNNKDWFGLGEQIWLSFLDGIKIVFVLLLQAMKTNIDIMVAIINEIDWRFVGETIMNLFLAGIVIIAGLIYAAVTGIAREISNSFTRMSWSSVGGDIVRGVISGINRMAGALGNAAKEAAMGAFNAAKSALGINSPSKLFRWLGKFSIVGKILGMRDKKKEHKREVDEITSYTGKVPRFNTNVNPNRPDSSSTVNNKIEIKIEGGKNLNADTLAKKLALRLKRVGAI